MSVSELLVLPIILDNFWLVNVLISTSLVTWWCPCSFLFLSVSLPLLTKSLVLIDFLSVLIGLRTHLSLVMTPFPNMITLCGSWNNMNFEETLSNPVHQEKR
jgi:hypothetical protein